MQGKGLGDQMGKKKDISPRRVISVILALEMAKASRTVDAILGGRWQ